ncbi:hypothetical protein MMC28_004531 [Mycoblastus sanguinarius]|nr:hypothetical protein [Mycoblastus sanguinarius]
MTINNGPTTIGTLSVSAYFPLPKIPAILSEWSALLPLICHLASSGEDHQMAGELALTGHLTVGLFPRLGYLDGISRFLDGGPDFLDRANTKGESSYKVWDVNWGSVFTRSNGAAISIITKYALRKRHKPVMMPETVLVEPSHSKVEAPATITQADLNRKAMAQSCFRRIQTLHVIRMNRKVYPPSFRRRISNILSSQSCEIAYVLVLLGAVALLCLLGAYGSAAVVLGGVVSKMLCRFLRMQRPPGYLVNNESHDACMLSAVHDNASTWYLYIGDRGVVDWMLNKTMLSTPPAGRFLTSYFRLAHLFQLLAMTFVAAQKGLDGVSLVVLMVANYALRWLSGDHHMARRWLEADNVCVDAHTFEFSGRTPMIGAIHMMSGFNNLTWMDDLLAPCPRRNVWLDELKCAASTRRQSDDAIRNLSSSDRAWVLLQSQLAIEAARLIQRQLTTKGRIGKDQLAEKG